MLKYVYLISYYISTYSSDFMSYGLPLQLSCVSLTLSPDQCEDTVINESTLLLVRGFHYRDWNFNKEHLGTGGPSDGNDADLFACSK